MDNKLIIKVKDFSITPGSRYIDEGDFSGEVYRKNILEPIFKESLQTGTKILIDLDGTIGYGTSWLEEVFGGLARIYGIENVIKLLEFKSDEEPYLINDIKEYIKNANKK